MWEQIQSNKKKSIFLVITMGIFLLIIGALFGEYYFGYDGFMIGASFAFIIFIILSLISYFAGDSILLSVSKAKEVTDKSVHPQLFNIVEEMKIAASLPVMPKIYIINEAAPNAFATGRNPNKSAVAVTSGLLARLNRDELQGVIAHEISHIINRDVLLMTIAGIMLGSIVFISEIFLRSQFRIGGSSKRYNSNSKSSGQGQLILIVVAIALAILAPILARLLYFAISRKREYLADASAVRLTRYPEGLASALEKISSTDLDLQSASKVTAPMYIVNPLKKKGMKLSNLTSTHPPISERVKILRSMMYGANYKDYEAAFQKATGKKSVIPPGVLKENVKAEIREAGAPILNLDPKSEKRNLGDLMMTMNNFLFIACACGLKLKIPPGFGTNKPEITCTKCGRKHEIKVTQSD
ncbi:MAG TPA: M48 family metallopeptidase [Ignavibacteriaceae bacterium]|nr:M48 family metallopeptidase [Ignavibacteriaceae bacterium]